MTLSSGPQCVVYQVHYHLETQKRTIWGPVSDLLSQKLLSRAQQYGLTGPPGDIRAHSRNTGLGAATVPPFLSPPLPPLLLFLPLFFLFFPLSFPSFLSFSLLSLTLLRKRDWIGFPRCHAHMSPVVSRTQEGDLAFFLLEVQELQSAFFTDENWISRLSKLDYKPTWLSKSHSLWAQKT